MRGTRLPAAPSRIKGQRSLVSRLQKLIIASYRYGEHRAATHDERQFAGRLFDGLKRTLDDVERREP